MSLQNKKHKMSDSIDILNSNSDIKSELSQFERYTFTNFEGCPNSFEKTIELDGDMISLINKHSDVYRYEEIGFPKIKFISLILQEIIDDIQVHPDKFSYKDFDTVNRIVKLVNDDLEVFDDQNNYLVTNSFI